MAGHSCRPGALTRLLPYGLAELASSYGFIAVFVAACVFRHVECDNEYQVTLHEFSEEVERMLVAIPMFLIGAYAVSGLLGHMTRSMWAVALAIVFVLRPIAGMVELIGTALPRSKRCAISFFGIRGIGSIYYLACGVCHAEFPDVMVVWALVTAVVIVSVIVHGLTARPVMDRVTSRSRR